MIEKMRDILSKDSEISLRKLNADSKKNVVEKFTILSTIEENDGLPSTREGGSAVCYEAVDENGVSGRLKEFYPFYDNQGYNLVRLGNHQLVVEKSIFGEDDFKRDCDDLITTYRLIDEARNINSSDLNNYMPSSIELYEGYSSYDGTVGSIYVWTKNDKRIITFDKYLNVVKGDVLNGKNAEIHLLNILNAICTLSKCIRSLHRNHIYHLDIKPANFGVCLGIDNRVDATNISLFDLNSVRHWNSELPLKFVGTRGFSPGELTQGNKLVISAYSDIYSIGATLYHSLMCLNESNVYFNDADYNKIKRLVASSELLCTSDINSNSRLFDCLVKILSECLNPDYNNRYKDSCCDGLIFDLNNAIDILYPEAKKQKTNKLGSEVKVQSEIVDIETELDTSIKTGATGAIQRLLLNKPLYEYMGNNTDMNILVLGGGTYARKFIDFAFEVSQIKDCKLTITVVSNECESDKERYLAARPAFEKFFTVDDKIVPEKDSYGTLLFKSTVTATGKDRLFSKDNIEVNNAIINDVLGAERDTKVSYIFIALGDDELNREIAKECMKHSELLSEKNLISFVQYKKQVKRCYEFCSSNANVVPVMVNEVITKSPEYKELRRMAFNCHILWDNTLSINIQKAKGKFSAPYYFNSSFSNVLSIKYKLHSMGIDLKKYSQCELMKYAEEFYKEITNVITLNELAMYEHRRWTTNCICDGWDTLEDYSSLKTAQKDKKNKLHPCIVMSDCEWRLNGPEWTHSKWNDPESIKNTFDHLDTMSLKLHQHFVKESENVDFSVIYDHIEKINAQLIRYPDVMNIWNSLTTVLIGIKDNTQNHIWVYEFYYSKFLKALSLLPDIIKQDIEERVEFINERLFPILESKKYVDYKAKDQVLVKNIPFILTYSTSIKLCIPFGVESKGEINNRVLFNNVSASLIINPSIITYIVDIDDFADDIGRFEKAITYAVRTLDERRMQAKIDVIFLKSSAVILDENIQSKTKNISERMGNIEVVEYADDFSLKNQLDTIFQERKRSRKSFTAIEKNTTGTSKLLRGFGCYAGIPTYSLNNQSTGERFITSKDCQFFNYIQFDDHLRITEMFASQKITGGTKPPEVPDYMDFWRMYKTPNPNDETSKNEKAWKTLCGVLKAQAKLDDLLGKFIIPSKKDDTFKERELIVPSVCYLGVKKVLERVSDINEIVFGKNPTVKHITSQSCLVTIISNVATYMSLESILSNPYLLGDSEKIRIEKIKNNIYVYFNNLMVKSLSIENLKKSFDEDENRLLNMLNTLKKNHKINCYTENTYKKTVSFCYASPQVKEILTNEGKILELYVYYKALEENYFDDIVCSCEIYDENNVSNELDLILTKNYKSLIVECKACTSLEQSFYHKLAQINQQYGINSTPVLVADTLEKTWWKDTESYDIQRARGNKYNIQTVYKHNDIKNIGKVLRKIMENL